MCVCEGASNNERQEKYQNVCAEIERNSEHEQKMNGMGVLLLLFKQTLGLICCNCLLICYLAMPFWYASLLHIHMHCQLFIESASALVKANQMV